MNYGSLKLQTKAPWPFVSGLDLGSESIKYLLLRRKGKKFKVVKFGRYYFRNGGIESPREVRQMLIKLFGKKGKFHKTKMVLGLDGQNLVVKRESFPQLSKKELLQTISYEIQREVDKESENVKFVFDYRVLGSDFKKKGNIEYLTMGVPEDVVDNKVRFFVAEGIIPAKVTPYVAALSNLIQFIPNIDLKHPVIILDIGAHRSMLVFLKNKKMDFFREIMIGGDDFTKAIAGTIFHEGRAIQFTREEAVEFKLKYGYPLGFSEGMTYRGAPLSEVGAMMRPVLERLTGEIHRSIDFYREKSGGENVENIYLIGGGARLKHLSDVLRDKIGINVSPLPVPKGLQITGSKEQKQAFKNKFLEQAVSLSLALESTQDGNLLPVPYKKIHRMKFIKRTLRSAAVGLLGLMVFITFKKQGEVSELKGQVAIMERRVSRSQNTGQVFNLMFNNKIELEKKIGALNQRLEQDENVIQVLRLFSHVIPKSLFLISLEYGNEKIHQRKNIDTEQAFPLKKVIQIQGMSRKPKTDVKIYVAQFIMELEKSGYFTGVELVKEMFDKEGKEYGFELLGYLKETGQQQIHEDKNNKNKK